MNPETRPDSDQPLPAALVEAILFSSAEPVSVDALVHATELPEPEVRAALGTIEERLGTAGSGILLRRAAGGFTLATDPACAAAVERFRDEAPPPRPSNAALEVISCALYLGPLTRSAISAVRGVNSDSLVRNLLDRGLLAEVGVDAGSPGSPALLDVTPDLLLAAGANSREDFPRLDALVSEEDLSRLRERLSVHDAPAVDAPLDEQRPEPA
jgi:segregation and condensation protein B